jgi:hypothetical protein
MLRDWRHGEQGKAPRRLLISHSHRRYHRVRCAASRLAFPGVREEVCDMKYRPDSSPRAARARQACRGGKKGYELCTRIYPSPPMILKEREGGPRGKKRQSGVRRRLFRPVPAALGSAAVAAPGPRRSRRPRNMGPRPYLKVRKYAASFSRDWPRGVYSVARLSADVPAAERTYGIEVQIGDGRWGGIE